MEITIWLATSFIGFTVALFGIREARKDRAAVRGLSNGRALVARQRLFAQTLRTLSFTSAATAGILALIGFLGPIAWLLIAANISWATITVTDAYVGWRLRNPDKPVRTAIREAVRDTIGRLTPWRN